MQGTIQSYVLCMADEIKKDPLKVKQCDTNSRWAKITLKAFNGEYWLIPFDVQIYINVHKADGTLATATCTKVDEHTVLTPITEQMTAVTGTQLGELYFLGSDGDIKSQSFPVVVYEAVMDQARIESSDDFQSLQGALREVKVSTELADIASQYATDQGNRAGDMAQRAEDAADSLQVAVDAAEAAKVSETNAKASEIAAAKTQQEVTDYVESQKAAFVGYSKRETDSQYANALTATMTGEGGVTVEDAWTAPVLGLDVAGKSEQVATTGANLFGGRALADKIAEVAVGTKIDTIQRTVTYYASNISKKEIFIDFSAGKEYTIILYGRNSDDGLSFCNMAVEYDDGTNGNLTFDSHGSDSYCIYHTIINKNTTKLFGYHNAGTTTLYYDKCGIFEGNIDLSAFEPYTGCAPSPSPDYPQDIISVGAVSTGAQLIPYPYVSKEGTYEGLTVKTTNGHIRINGTTSTGTNYNIYSIPPGEYVLKIKGTHTGMDLKVHDPAASKTLVVIKSSQNADEVVSGTFIVPEDHFATLYFNQGSGNILVNIDVDIMMTKPNQINASYEPYTGGKPSPSVEYPQVVEVSVAGANLLDSDMFPTNTLNGVTLKNVGDGSFILNGTCLSSANFDAEINIIKTGIYTLCDNASGIFPNNIYARTQLYNAESQKTFRINNNSHENIVSGELIQGKYILQIRIDKDHTYTNCTLKLMLNAGDTALPWEPFRTTSAAITLTEPLHGVGEYRDRIMCKDGVWGIERYWRSTVLDGSFQYTELNKLAISKEIRPSGIKIKPIKGLFNNFNVYDSTWDRDKIGIGAFKNGIEAFSVISLRIPVDAVPVEYMAAHPTEAIYQPYDFPTWEPLPTATQQALNALTTYAGTTHLTITVGGPPAEVTLEYVQDTQKAIEQHDTANRQYTDNQIAAIVAALPTATQAAIVDNQTTKLLQEV